MHNKDRQNENLHQKSVLDVIFVNHHPRTKVKESHPVSSCVELQTNHLFTERTSAEASAKPPLAVSVLQRGGEAPALIRLLLSVHLVLDPLQHLLHPPQLRGEETAG